MRALPLMSMAQDPHISYVPDALRRLVRPRWRPGIRGSPDLAGAVGTWAISPIGEGGRPGPDRRRPWVNFTARFRTGSLRGGGEVIGDGAEQAGLVRLTFTSGTAIEDTVENGVVLFAASPGVESRARVEILSSAASSSPSMTSSTTSTCHGSSLLRGLVPLEE